MSDYLYTYRWQIVFILLGLIFLATGIFLNRSNFFQQTTVEIVQDTNTEKTASAQVVVEVSGSVASPGVFSLPSTARVNDALQQAGGTTTDANAEWMDKYLNKAASVVDGQKIYIPSQSEDVSDNQDGGGEGTLAGASERVNINTASQSELESLWGIGPVTAQNIIEQRMYTSVEELVSKGIVKQNVYDRNKDILTTY